MKSVAAAHDALHAVALAEDLDELLEHRLERLAVGLGERDEATTCTRPSPHGIEGSAMPIGDRRARRRHAQRVRHGERVGEGRRGQLLALDRALDVVLVDHAFGHEQPAQAPDDRLLAAVGVESAHERRPGRSSARARCAAGARRRVRRMRPAAACTRSTSASVRNGWMRTNRSPADGRIDRGEHEVGVDRCPVGVDARLDPDDLDRLAERAVDARAQQLVQLVVAGAHDRRGQQLVGPPAALEAPADVHRDVRDLVVQERDAETLLQPARDVHRRPRRSSGTST